MKIVIALISLVVAAQAVDWHNIKPKHAFKTPIRAFSKSDRIIGGTVASPGLLPFQAGVFIDNGFFCGGSLIKENKVITAAHCCSGGQSFEVHLGAQDIYDENEANLQIATSSNGQIHEQYNPSSLANDICIIHLDAPVIGEGIAPVRLPSRSQASTENFEGYVATISGWGLTSTEDPGVGPELEYVSVNIMSNAACSAYYGGSITDGMLCCDAEGGTVGICNGDSGGPLTIVEPDGYRTQVGLVSFGSSAGCQSGGPNGYTRLTRYVYWLEQNALVPIRP